MTPWPDGDAATRERISAEHGRHNVGLLYFLQNDEAVPRSRTDWPGHIAKLKASGYDGTITLEVFSPSNEYLLLSRDLLRRWWDAE